MGYADEKTVDVCESDMEESGLGPTSQPKLPFIGVCGPPDSVSEKPVETVEQSVRDAEFCEETSEFLLASSMVVSGSPTQKKPEFVENASYSASWPCEGNKLFIG